MIYPLNADIFQCKTTIKTSNNINSYVYMYITQAEHDTKFQLPITTSCTMLTKSLIYILLPFLHRYSKTNIQDDTRIINYTLVEKIFHILYCKKNIYWKSVHLLHQLSLHFSNITFRLQHSILQKTRISLLY